MKTKPTLVGLASSFDGLSIRMDGLATRMDGLASKIDELAEMLQAFATNVDQRFAGVDQRFDRVEQRLDRIETTMATKSYVDYKLADFKGDMQVSFKQTDGKINTLTEILNQKGIFSKKETAQVQALGPFPA